jgi:predicted transcriptional regulator
MEKQEIVFREVSCAFIENGRTNFTQLELSKRLELSLSIVNKAVRNLSDINAVRIKQRSFDVIALDRLLLYWATHRTLKKDTIYQTRVDMSVRDIEKTMPDGIAFTGYTAYRLLFKEAPADYSEVYLYAGKDILYGIKRRFAAHEGVPNVIVLKCDTVLENAIDGHKLKNSSVCAAQLFVDLWNMNQWYSKDFVDALARRVGI